MKRNVREVYCELLGKASKYDNLLRNFYILLTASGEGVDPSGQPDRFLGVFFLTPSLIEAAHYWTFGLISKLLISINTDIAGSPLDKHASQFLGVGNGFKSLRTIA